MKKNIFFQKKVENFKNIYHKISTIIYSKYFQKGKKYIFFKKK